MTDAKIVTVDGLTVSVRYWNGGILVKDNVRKMSAMIHLDPANARLLAQAILDAVGEG